MMMLALGFVFGAWLLQQQAVLPALQGAWILVPSLAVLIKFEVVAFKLSLNPRFKSPVKQLIIFL